MRPGEVKSIRYEQSKDDELDSIVSFILGRQSLPTWANDAMSHSLVGFVRHLFIAPGVYLATL